MPYRGVRQNIRQDIQDERPADYYERQRATKKGSMMKPSSKDEVAGKIHEVKGAVREKVGKLANNPDLEADGKVEKVAGRVQKKIGQVKKVLGQ
jgi:uncharacterized protein YjbJ (UPF0337 family)